MKPKIVYAFLRFGCLPTGLVLIWQGWEIPLSSGWVAMLLFSAKVFSLLAGIFVTSLGAFVVQNVYFSRSRLPIETRLPMKTWPITQDRKHNSNVDMIWFREAFYLVYASSPYHMGTKHSILVVKRSPDGQHWQQVAELGHEEDDIRDPKFAVIGEKLFIYALLNRETQPRPYTTQVAWSEDGSVWSALTSLGHEGWLFWRPKTRDGPPGMFRRTGINFITTPCSPRPTG